MSTATPSTGPQLDARGWLRFIWRQLTSMRTALLLLLLLALAAIPGSVWPQRSIDQARVTTYLSEHPRSGPWLDRLQLFDVYTSVWFSAIYLLLVISLIGCILPRTAQLARALRARPPAVPRHPERLSAHRITDVDAPAEQVEAELRRLLRRRGYRLRGDPGGDVGTRDVAGESGHLREAGNLAFHYGVVAVVVALAAGYLVGWRGDVIVPVGQSFTNTPGAYHTFTGGPWARSDGLQPFSVRLDDMTVRFEERPGSGQLGAPRDFQVATTTADGPGQPSLSRTLSVNGPLRFRGAEVYLLGNGYAPRITVRDTAGKVLYSQATAFLPQDANYRSTGAVKVPAAPTPLGFSGVFLPTAVEGESGATAELDSAFPDLRAPTLLLSLWEGNLFPDDTPQSVYELRTEQMRQVRTQAGPVELRLAPGQSVELPGGRGSLTLEGVDRWAGVSTRYDPAKPFALASAIVMILGLLASLIIPRRRVFGRITPTSAGGSRVILAGLAQREDAALPELLERLEEDLHERLDASAPRRGTQASHL